MEHENSDQLLQGAQYLLLTTMVAHIAIVSYTPQNVPQHDGSSFKPFSLSPSIYIYNYAHMYLNMLTTNNSEHGIEGTFGYLVVPSKFKVCIRTVYSHVYIYVCVYKFMYIYIHMYMCV